MKKQFVIALIATFAYLAACAAEVYPSRPITLIVPFAAGGPTDMLARSIADRMRGSLGQRLVIENVTGAGGSLGVGRVARAIPDGYTVVIGNWSTHVANAVIYPLQYDLLKDFEPVALLPSSPQLIVTGKTVSAKDLEALLLWLKSNKASAGTAGIGSASHVGGLYFETLTGAKLTFVPYRGTAPAIQDLMGGQTDLMFDQAANSLPYVRSGSIKAYAVTSKTRLAAAPDIPTVDEAGLPGFYVSVWHGLWAPKGTPPEIIARLDAAIVEALADPALRQHFNDLGQEIPAQSQLTPLALASTQKAEMEKWWPIIKAANIKGD
jgi:tripartite-type tricarboxylate transporter receptor subunit TctC